MPHGGIELEEVVGKNEVDRLENKCLGKPFVDESGKLGDPKIQRFQTQICWNAGVKTSNITAYHPCIWWNGFWKLS